MSNFPPDEPSIEELQREKLLLDIEKLRGELKQQAKTDQREMIRLVTTVATATAGTTVAIIALLTFILSKL